MIENLVMFIKNNLYFICIFLSFLIIISRFIRNNNEKKKNNLEIKEKLDKKQILKRLPIFSKIIFLVILLLFGLYAMYVFIPKFNSTDILSNIIFIITICAWFTIIICNVYVLASQYYDISHDNYVITEDILSKRTIVNEGKGGYKRLKYSFLFEKFFKKYTNVVCVNDIIFETSKEGDEFYLVFLKNHKNPLVFNKNIYSINDEENNKIISIDELSNYVKKIKVNSQENNMFNGTVELIDKTIINSFYGNKEKKKILILTIISVIFSCLAIFTISNENFLLIFIIAMILVVITVIYVIYIYSIIRSIKRNKYTILKDEIIYINNNVSFNNSNKVLELKFKKYNKPIYEDENKYCNTKVGDEFYLLFLNNAKEPMKIYDAKKYFSNNK